MDLTRIRQISHARTVTQFPEARQIYADEEVQVPNAQPADPQHDFDAFLGEIGLQAEEPIVAQKNSTPHSMEEPMNLEPPAQLSPPRAPVIPGSVEHVQPAPTNPAPVQPAPIQRPQAARWDPLKPEAPPCMDRFRAKKGRDPNVFPYAPCKNATQALCRLAFDVLDIHSPDSMFYLIFRSNSIRISSFF